MLIDGVGRPAGDLETGPDFLGSGGDDFQVWIAGFDRVVELGEAGVVAVRVVEEVFIADLDVVQGEGITVAVGGAVVRPREWWCRR